MFLGVFIVLFVCVHGRDLHEPKFQVLTPDELMVEVPHYENVKLVTFRIGVRRKQQEAEDLELGENVIDNNRIFIYDQRLNLRQGDVVNYLLAFKDKDEGYQAQTGKYIFDGVYYKKPFGRRQRFRRDLTTAVTTEAAELNTGTSETEEFNPIESRFGGGHHHHHGGGHWPHHGAGGYPEGGFNPFGPGRGPPQFPPYPPFGPRPNFGEGCNDHRHDMCHGRDTERWESSTTSSVDVDYHCRICNKYRPQKTEPTTSKNTASEDSPEIDIRFSKD